MKVLILGGAGFVGSNLTGYILEHHKDVEVRAIDDLRERGCIYNLRYYMTDPGFEFYMGSIYDPAFMEIAMDDIDVIVNAVMAEREDQVFSALIYGTYTVLKHLSTSQMYIHISDYMLYGKYDVYPHIETDPLRPRNTIQAAQVGAEAIVRSYRAMNPRMDRLHIVRPVTLFGPRDREYNMMGDLLMSAATGEAPKRRYGQHMVELMHVQDFCKAIMSLIEADRSSALTKLGYDGVLNIGSGFRISIPALKAMLGVTEDWTGDSLLETEKYGVSSVLAQGLLGAYCLGDVRARLVNEVAWYKETCEDSKG